MGQTASFDELWKAYQAQAQVLEMNLSSQWCKQRCEQLVCAANPSMCWGGGQSPSPGPSGITGRPVAKKKCGGCGGRKAR